MGTKHKKNLIVIKTLKDLFKSKDLTCSNEDQALLTQQVVVVVQSYIDTKLLQKKEKIDEHLQTKVEQPKEIEEDCTCGQADCNKCVGDE